MPSFFITHSIWLGTSSFFYSHFGICFDLLVISLLCMLCIVCVSYWQKCAVYIISIPIFRFFSLIFIHRLYDYYFTLVVLLVLFLLVLLVPLSIFFVLICVAHEGAQKLIYIIGFSLTLPKKKRIELRDWKNFMICNFFSSVCRLLFFFFCFAAPAPSSSSNFLPCSFCCFRLNFHTLCLQSHFFMDPWV